MSFERSTAYKIFETVGSRIYRFGAPVRSVQNPGRYLVGASCPSCKHEIGVQINLERNLPLEDGAIPYPVDTDLMNCPQCGGMVDLKYIRQNLKMCPSGVPGDGFLGMFDACPHAHFQVLTSEGRTGIE